MALTTLGRLTAESETKTPTGLFNARSQTQAQGLLGGVLPGGWGNPPVRGTREFIKAYSEMPWLRAVASRVAQSMAAVEWELFVKTSKGKPVEGRMLQRMKGDRRHATIKRLLKASVKKGSEIDDGLRQIEDHPLLDMLHSANSFHTGEQMRKVTQLHLDIVGEAFWLKERDGMGTIVGVWPIPPDWILTTPTPLVPFYRVQFRAWKGSIPDTEFLWFQDTDPSNPYGRGSGVGYSLADELETDEFAAKHTKAFFYNRARPDLIVYPKTGTLRSEAVQRMEEDWLGAAQGFWKAFKPYFMTREVGIHELDQNFRSMQLVQIREHERNTILQVFGVPPEILGVLEHSNRATIDAADYLFSRYVLRPRLEFMRSQLQERLVPEYDDRLIIDFVDPVSEDKATFLEAMKGAPWAASVDEWREVQGLPPLEDDLGAVHVFQNTVKEHTMGEADPVPAGFDPATGRPFAPFDPDKPNEPPIDPTAEDAKAFIAWRRAARRFLG